MVDGDGAVLLMEVTEPKSRTRWWITPGGGVDAGEDDVTALQRELSEEIGLELPAVRIGPAVWHRRVMLQWNGESVRQHETYYLVESERFDPVVCRDGDPDVGWHDAIPRWWTPAEMRGTSDDRFAPVDLADLLDDLVRVGAPAEPVDISR